MFETKRLKMVPYKDIQPEDIFKYGSDPEVSKFIGWPLFTTIEDAKKLYDGVLENVEKGTHHYYGVIEKDSNRHIGSVMIFGVSNQVAEVGYVLDQEYWGKGYGTESVGWMVDYGFNTIGLQRQHAHIVAINTASVNIVEKLGFTKEGVLREHYKVNDKYYDGYCFGLLKREYLK